MIFKRYSDPLTLLDNLIENNQFNSFIDTLIDKVNEDDIYEFYLHKVFDMTFEEFKKSLKGEQAQDTFNNEEEIKTTVQKSNKILSDFKPQEEVKF